MLPLEVVVRGYLAGSAWRDYQAGRPISGIRLPVGLSRNEKFPVPLITPSVKVNDGHDRPVSCEDIVREKIVDAELWAEVERAAVALFHRGQELADGNGLILVDTKYEFGVVDGRLVLADEIHSPDSSRYWYAESYLRRLQAAEEQRELDKEPFRRWLLERGFSGEGEPPAIPDEVRAETAWRYVQAYEAITGEIFQPRSSDPQSETRAIARIVSERLA
jgi:phosphoribosylaminoimidazole-succinocarboxamide synthase